MSLLHPVRVVHINRLLHLYELGHGLVRVRRDALRVDDFVPVCEARLLVLNFEYFFQWFLPLLLFYVSNGLVNDPPAFLQCFKFATQVIEIEVGACLRIKELFLVLARVLNVIIRRIYINKVVEHVYPNEVRHVGVHHIAFKQLERKIGIVFIGALVPDLGGL